MASAERDLEGVFIVVTGANTGIGRVTAVALARRGASLVLACRSEEKTRPVLAEIRALGAGSAEFVALDLSSLESVRATAPRIRARVRHEPPRPLSLDDAALSEPSPRRPRAHRQRIEPGPL